MIFELIGALIEGIGDLLGELFEGGAALAAELGTAAVAVGAGAAALGAVIALAELSIDAIKKYLCKRDVAAKIERILNNDQRTLNAMVSSKRLANANKFSISDMDTTVHDVRRTRDGQKVAIVRVLHPVGRVYHDVVIAGNKNIDVQAGLKINL